MPVLSPNQYCKALTENLSDLDFPHITRRHCIFLVAKTIHHPPTHTSIILLRQTHPERCAPDCVFLHRELEPLIKIQHHDPVVLHYELLPVIWTSSKSYLHVPHSPKSIQFFAILLTGCFQCFDTVGQHEQHVKALSVGTLVVAICWHHQHIHRLLRHQNP